MPAERKARLDALSFRWGVRSDKSEEGYGHLEDFVKENGHCRVRQGYLTADGYQLGTWVHFQRQTADTVPAERKARLDALGFVWDPRMARWEEGYGHLEDFVKENGHCRVAQKHVAADGYRLGTWVDTQRQTKDAMPAERKARLDELGFEWSARAKQVRLRTGLRVHGTR